MLSPHRLAIVSALFLTSAAAFPFQQDSRRDPTQPDPRILDALGGRPDEGSVHGPAPSRARAPSVTLRALVVAAGREGSAIVQCGESLYSVHAGSVFTASDAVEMRVVSLTADEIRLQVVSTGDGLVLR